MRTARTRRDLVILVPGGPARVAWKVAARKLQS